MPASHFCAVYRNEGRFEEAKLMEPFTLIGLGAALMFVLGLGRDRIDFSTPTIPRTPATPETKETEISQTCEQLYPSADFSGSGVDVRRSESAGRKQAGATVRRSTRVLTDDEREEAAAALRKAAGK